MPTRTADEVREEAEARQLDKRCRTLRILIWVCTALTVIQLLSGWAANSLSLIGDAAMMGVDVVGYIVALVAEKTKTPRKKKRADRYGAAISFVLLGSATLFVLFSAMDRLTDDDDPEDGEKPMEVSGEAMFWFTMLNLVADLVLLKLFQQAVENPEQALDPEAPNVNLNMSAALAHLLADLLRALAVLISGLLIWMGDWDSVKTDAWCSFFVSLFIILGTLQVGKRLCFEPKDAARYASFDDELDGVEGEEIPDVTFDAVVVSVGGGGSANEDESNGNRATGSGLSDDDRLAIADDQAEGQHNRSLAITNGSRAGGKKRSPIDSAPVGAPALTNGDHGAPAFDVLPNR